MITLILGLAAVSLGIVVLGDTRHPAAHHAMLFAVVLAILAVVAR
jgi:hypothetical protein